MPEYVVKIFTERFVYVTTADPSEIERLAIESARSTADEAAKVRVIEINFAN